MLLCHLDKCVIVNHDDRADHCDCHSRDHYNTQLTKLLLDETMAGENIQPNTCLYMNKSGFWQLREPTSLLYQRMCLGYVSIHTNWIKTGYKLNASVIRLSRDTYSMASDSLELWCAHLEALILITGH